MLDVGMLDVKTCPVCRQSWPTTRAPAPMLERLERVGDVWTEVASGASRWYRRNLVRRYPGWEFRHEKMSLFGDYWRVEARRKVSV